MSEHQVVLSIVTVAGLGVGAQWLAWRLKMPAIVLPAAGGLIEVLIMSEEKDVEFNSAECMLEPAVGDTIIYFARNDQTQTCETVDAPLG